MRPRNPTKRDGSPDDSDGCAVRGRRLFIPSKSTQGRSQGGDTEVGTRFCTPRRGRDKTARGTAPGTEAPLRRSPVRVAHVKAQARFVAPFQGWYWRGPRVPGRCPGLICFGPFGARITATGPTSLVRFPKDEDSSNRNRSGRHRLRPGGRDGSQVMPEDDGAAPVKSTNIRGPSSGDGPVRPGDGRPTAATGPPGRARPRQVRSSSVGSIAG
jgi:hypothetical protein